MKKIIAAALLSVSAIVPAFAADPGPYIGAQVGDNYVGVLGGYQIDKMFAVEAHYNKLDTVRGQVGGASYKAEGDNYGLSAVALFPLNIEMPLSIFGKLGVERTEVETSFANMRVKGSETDVGASAGVQYDLTPNFHVRAGAHLAGEMDDFFLNAILKF